MEGGENGVLRLIGPKLNMVFTCDPTIIREINNRRDVFVTPYQMQDAFGSFSRGLVAVDGAPWKARRAIASKAFQPHNLTAVSTAADKVAVQWLRMSRSVASKQPDIAFDLEFTFRSMMLNLMGAFVVGKDMGEALLHVQYRPHVPANPATGLLSAMDVIFQGINDRMSGPKALWKWIIPSQKRADYAVAVELVRSFVRLQLEQKVKERAAGLVTPAAELTLLDHLLNAMEDPSVDSSEAGAGQCPMTGKGQGGRMGQAKLSTDAVLDIATDAVAGALDTSSHTLAFLFYALSLDHHGLLHPDALQLDHHLPSRTPGSATDTSWVNRPLTTVDDAVKECKVAPAAPQRAWKRLEQEILGVLGSHDLSAPLSVELLLKASDRLPYTEGCIKETLRLFNTFASTGRSAAEDTTIANGAYSVPRGTMVVPLMITLHTSERYFPRPWEFLPERWLPHAPPDIAPRQEGTAPIFAAFGGGPKACVGRRAAMVQMTAIIIRFVQAFSSVSAYMGSATFHTATVPDIRYALSGKLMRSELVKGRFR